MSAAKDNKKRMILPMRRSEEFRDKLKRMTPEEYEAWAERQRNSPLRLPDSKEHLSQLRQFHAAWRRRGRIPAEVAGVCEDVALEDHEAWTERIMAMPAGRGLRIVDTEEGPLPLLPGTMFLTDAEERTPGAEVSECDKEVAAWLEGELAHAAPFLNSKIGPGFPEVNDERPAFEVIEGGAPEDEEPDTDGA